MAGKSRVALWIIPVASTVFCLIHVITISPASIPAIISSVWNARCAAHLSERRENPGFQPIRSLASAWTQPGRARCRLMRKTSRLDCTRNGKTILPRSAGYGRITPAIARRRALPKLLRSIVLTISPSAATSIPPSGGGAKSGAV